MEWKKKWLRPRSSPKHRLPAWQTLLVLVILALWQGREAWQRAHIPPSEGLVAVQEAFAGEKSGVWLEASGQVKKVLPDDQQGDRHQRFLLDLDRRHTVLIAHNVDLATRVPAAVGETLTVRGRYEWSEQGGVIHWTHRDPQRPDEGGWIRHKGQTYE